ncbi:MAG: septum formation initiator family protein [Chitinophagaceae bacterium]|nr:septum formation initiator family protein [Chitinophagaceae bacterium]
MQQPDRNPQLFSRIRKKIQSLPNWLKNKYFLSFTGFLVILLFFDKNNIFNQIERTRDLQKLQQSKASYTQRIEQEKQMLQDLQKNPRAIEKFARENYLMKRPNEEIFLIPENYENPKK